MTDDVLRSLALSVHVLGVDTVIVMQHTKCGLVGVRDEELRRITGADLGFLPIDDHAAALQRGPRRVDRDAVPRTAAGDRRLRLRRRERRARRRRPLGTRHGGEVMSTADEVTVEAERDRISATGVAAAPPAVVFDILRRPRQPPGDQRRRHRQGDARGSELLELGSKLRDADAPAACRTGSTPRSRRTNRITSSPGATSAATSGAGPSSRPPTVSRPRSPRRSTCRRLVSAGAAPVRVPGAPPRQRRRVGHQPHRSRRRRLNGCRRQSAGAKVWCTASTLLPSGSWTNAPK